LQEVYYRGGRDSGGFDAVVRDKTIVMMKRAGLGQDGGELSPNTNKEGAFIVGSVNVENWNNQACESAINQCFPNLKGEDTRKAVEKISADGAKVAEGSSSVVDVRGEQIEVKKKFGMLEFGSLLTRESSSSKRGSEGRSTSEGSSLSGSEGVSRMEPAFNLNEQKCIGFVEKHFPLASPCKKSELIKGLSEDIENMPRGSHFEVKGELVSKDFQGRVTFVKADTENYCKVFLKDVLHEEGDSFDAKKEELLAAAKKVASGGKSVSFGVLISKRKDGVVEFSKPRALADSCEAHLKKFHSGLSKGKIEDLRGRLANAAKDLKPGESKEIDGVVVLRGLNGVVEFSDQTVKKRCQDFLGGLPGEPVYKVNLLPGLLKQAEDLEKGGAKDVDGLAGAVIFKNHNGEVEFFSKQSLNRSPEILEEESGTPKGWESPKGIKKNTFEGWDSSGEG
jgi:hypothetical protein